MPVPVQDKLLKEILRTRRDGGVVLVRSVEDQCIAENTSMQKHFQLIKEESDLASEQALSRQYRRVNFYCVVH